MFNSINFFRIIIIMMMITTYLPLVYTRLPAVFGSHHLYTAIFVLALIVSGSKVLLNKFVLFVLGYGLFTLFMQRFVWTHMSEWSSKALWFNDYYPIVIGILILTYFYESRDYNGLAIVCKYSLLFMFITTIGTIVASYALGSVNRVAIYGDSAEALATQAVFFKYGSGGYNASIVFMSVIAIIVYYLKKINLSFIDKRWALCLFIALLFGAVLRLQIFTNLIFAAVVFLFSMVNSNSRNQLFAWVACIAIMVYLIPTSVYVSVFNSLSRLFEGRLGEVSYKFSEIANLLEFGDELVDASDNELTARAARGSILWEVFKNYPILGFFTSPESNFIEKKGIYHLYWFSTLAKFGIINFLFYICIFYRFIMMQKQRLSRSYFYYFFIAVMSVILYGIPKVTGGREVWYFVFIIAPGCYYLPLVSKKYIKKLQFLRRKQHIAHQTEE